MPRKSKQKWEFGDFQTPPSLAKQAISVLSEFGISPKTIIEPSCGKGSFLIAAALAFTSAKCIVGADVNAEYLAGLQPMVSKLGIQDKSSFLTGDFFSLDWPTILAPLPEPILIVGNPPWVTSSELSAMKSRNLPQKSNFQKHRGLDAKTGKKQFRYLGINAAPKPRMANSAARDNCSALQDGRREKSAFPCLEERLSGQGFKDVSH